MSWVGRTDEGGRCIGGGDAPAMPTTETGPNGIHIGRLIVDIALRQHFCKGRYIYTLR